jgi:hypothetical protein
MRLADFADQRLAEQHNRTWARETWLLNNTLQIGEQLLP